MGVYRLHQRQASLATARPKKIRVREIVRENPIPLHLEESREGPGGPRVLRVGPYQDVVQMRGGLRNLVEDADGQRHVAAEGESRDELRGHVDVPVEAGLEDLGVDLLDVAQVGAPVEVRQLLLEDPPRGDPPRGPDRHGHFWVGVRRSEGRVRR